MTCIVGLVQGGDVYIGGDSAAVSTNGYDIRIGAYSKVFVNGVYAMGYTSSFRMGQILQFAKLPAPPVRYSAEDVLYRFMCTEFIDAVRQRLRDGGFAKKENEVETGGQFLVGVSGALFTVMSDYQVHRTVDNFFAVGAGYSYALGALWSAPYNQLEPVERVEQALRTAARFSSCVCEPFHVVRSPR